MDLQMTLGRKGLTRIAALECCPGSQILPHTGNPTSALPPKPVQPVVGVVVEAVPSQAPSQKEEGGQRGRARAEATPPPRALIPTTVALPAGPQGPPDGSRERLSHQAWFDSQEGL